jgi:plasmid stabilization system protein ParE
VTSRYEPAAPAERDLEDIFFEVHERHGRLAAERVLENLLRTLDLFARMPEMGRHRPELWPPPHLGHGPCLHRRSRDGRFAAFGSRASRETGAGPRLLVGADKGG